MISCPVTKLTVIVVNWNSGDQLSKCLRSLNGVDSIVVVDNNSNDVSLECVKEFPAIKWIILNENHGFGRACNIGAYNLKSKYFLFINPDAFVYEKTISTVIDFMDNASNHDVGICGVQLIDEHNRISHSCSRFPTPFRLFLQAIGLDKIIPKLGVLMAEWSHDNIQDVDQVIGAFFMVRLCLFEDLDGFDEQFFVYFEEVDFSYRARKTGWRSVYLSNTNAFHAGGGTSDQVKAKRLFYSLRSRLLYSFKHFHVLGAILVLMTTLFIEPISRSVLAIGRRSWSSLAETWEGYGMLWRWLPQWIFNGVTR